MIALTFHHLLEVTEQQLNLEPEPLARSCGLSWPLPQGPEERLPWELLTALWARLVGLTGERDLPVRVALSAAHRERGLLAMLCTSLPVLGDSLKALVRYWPLVSDAYRWRLRATEARQRLELQSGVSIEECGGECAVEFDVLDITLAVVRAVGGPLHGLSISFAHSATHSTHRYEEALECPVRFGAGRTAISFAVEATALPMRHARPGMVRHLIPKAERLLRRSGQPVSIASQVNALLPDLVREGRTNADAMAARLGIGRRTLERRLRAEKTTFRTLLDACRFGLAGRWLRRDVVLADIAERLGYSDPSAFSRAFARWSGSRPSDYRKTQDS